MQKQIFRQCSPNVYLEIFFIERKECALEKRLGVVAIVVEGDRSVTQKMQSILSDFGDIIVGRMGIPDHDDNIAVISLIVKGTVERISALTGKLGKLENITVKSAVTQVAVK